MADVDLEPKNRGRNITRARTVRLAPGRMLHRAMSASLPARRTLEDLEIVIQRNLNTIERTGSQERLKQQETEKTQTKGELEKLSLQFATTQTEITPEAMNIILAAWRAQFNGLQESGNVREIKAWLMQFVSRIELGYNRARIFYTYPMIDLFSTGRNLQSTLPLFGGISLKNEKPIMIEWSK